MVYRQRRRNSPIIRDCVQSGGRRHLCKRVGAKRLDLWGIQLAHRVSSFDRVKCKRILKRSSDRAVPRSEACGNKMTKGKSSSLT